MHYELGQAHVGALGGRTVVCRLGRTLERPRELLRRPPRRGPRPVKAMLPVAASCLVKCPSMCRPGPRTRFRRRVHQPCRAPPATRHESAGGGGLRYWVLGRRRVCVSLRLEAASAARPARQRRTSRSAAPRDGTVHRALRQGLGDLPRGRTGTRQGTRGRGRAAGSGHGGGAGRRACAVGQGRDAETILRRSRFRLR